MLPQVEPSDTLAGVEYAGDPSHSNMVKRSSRKQFETTLPASRRERRPKQLIHEVLYVSFRPQAMSSILDPHGYMDRSPE